MRREGFAPPTSPLPSPSVGPFLPSAACYAPIVAHFDIDPIELADWIAVNAGDRLWAVDGEVEIAGALRLPCQGSELADHLRSFKGRTLRIFVPEGAPELTSVDFAALAAQEDDGRVFDVCWLSGVDSHWIIAEDTLAQELQAADLKETNRPLVHGEEVARHLWA
jgi:hypothetical protein